MDSSARRPRSGASRTAWLEPGSRALPRGRRRACTLGAFACPLVRSAAYALWRASAFSRARAMQLVLIAGMALAAGLGVVAPSAVQAAEAPGAGRTAEASADIAAPEAPATRRAAEAPTVGRAAEAPAAASATYAQAVRELAVSAARPAAATRVEVEVGTLDPRLRLAPCERVEPHLPAGTRLWGRTRIGLRCTRGPTAWNVYLPVTVKVWGMALVAAQPLPAGTVLAAGDLRPAETDLAAEATPALVDAARAVGRTLAHALNTGQGLHEGHLRARQWFAAGDTVTVVARGDGFRVSGEAQALTAGTEGQPARVRTAGGRVLAGMPVGERRVELDP